MILKFKNNYRKCCLISILFICVFQSESVFASREPIIRVLISKNNNLRIRSDRSIPLTIEGKFFSSKKIKGLTLKNEKDRKILYFDKNKQKKYDLKSNQQFQVSSSDGRGIWVGRKRFSGKLNLFVLDSEILVVNVLGIEKYLTSVVGSEMPTKWPIEALKAQAIASRTYALKQKGNNLFDIDSTQKNQVYNGLESRTYKTIRAVKSTRSLVLTYKNKLINALFHSSSGGMTENSQDVWKNKYPYLSSVKDFDKNNPKFRWKKKISSNELINLFPNIGGLKNIEILDITSTGRVKNVNLIGADGSDQMSGVALRKRLGLKSNFVRFKFFEEELNNNTPLKKGLIVFGQGAGHGVGMSQWGAKYLASRGHKAERILKYFYRGVQIKPFKKDYL
ncbi:SpoIID/LytB domain-containing protein [uncultured Prochlorococcus sp.]|uniref:SpoIID/LytB domain-containing protein n=1 Tax=uncultured Prochlorococcus sp. TaxID=159733 RepID=UPI0025861464|nr:SpoIID/LytB domain-containing protein [uncultured Prochlorococcus sp.]